LTDVGQFEGREFLYGLLASEQTLAPAVAREGEEREREQERRQAQQQARAMERLRVDADACTEG
jgi:hypothetical protein